MHDVSYKYFSTFYNDSRFFGLVFLTDLLPMAVTIVYLDFKYPEKLHR